MELLISNYTIKELGTTWVVNGHLYQSFIGAAIKDTKVEPEDTKVEPEVTKVETKKRPVETKGPTAKKTVRKRKSPAKPKETKDVPSVPK